MQKIKKNKGFMEKKKRFREKGGKIGNKKEDGITLIALIVTIIVLLILTRCLNISFDR